MRVPGRPSVVVGSLVFLFRLAQSQDTAHDPAVPPSVDDEKVPISFETLKTPSTNSAPDTHRLLDEGTETIAATDSDEDRVSEESLASDSDPSKHTTGNVHIKQSMDTERSQVTRTFPKDSISEDETSSPNSQAQDSSTPKSEVDDSHRVEEPSTLEAHMGGSLEELENESTHNEDKVKRQGTEESTDEELLYRYNVMHGSTSEEPEVSAAAAAIDLDGDNVQQYSQDKNSASVSQTISIDVDAASGNTQNAKEELLAEEVSTIQSENERTDKSQKPVEIDKETRQDSNHAILDHSQEPETLDEDEGKIENESILETTGEETGAKSGTTETATKDENGTGDEAKATHERQKKKSGSLADFVSKVSPDLDDSKPIKFEGAPIEDEDNSPGQSIEEVPPASFDGEYPKPYCGVWGVFRWERTYADLNILFLLYQDLFLKDEKSASEYIENLVSTSSAPLVMDSSSETTSLGTDRDENKKDTVTDEDSPTPTSVNTQFVEGLDDIDKFFEGVDPPDELDVGAAGSSLQEVLMGQGTRIVLKRISMALKAIREAFVKTKDKVIVKVKSLEGKLKSFEWKKIEFKRENVAQALAMVCDFARNAFQAVQDVIDEMFEGDELADEELRQMAFQIQKATGSGGETESSFDNDIQELIRRSRQDSPKPKR